MFAVLSDADSMCALRHTVLIVWPSLLLLHYTTEHSPIYRFLSALDNSHSSYIGLYAIGEQTERSSDDGRQYNPSVSYSHIIHTRIPLLFSSYK